MNIIVLPEIFEQVICVATARLLLTAINNTNITVARSRFELASFACRLTVCCSDAPPGSMEGTSSSSSSESDNDQSSQDHLHSGTNYYE